MENNTIDVAKIMAEITEEAEKRYNQVQEEQEEENVEVVEPLHGELCLGIKQRNHLIHVSLPRVRACDGIHVRIPNYEDKGPIARKFLHFVARIVSKLSRFIVFQQNDVNNTLCNTTEWLQASVLSVADWSEEIEKRIATLSTGIEALTKENRELKKIVSQVNQKNDIADKFYLEFEEIHRGSVEKIKKRLQYYVDNYVLPNFLPEANGMVLDIGCGRGEWLELLAENGYRGVGIDVNKESLRECKNANIKLYCTDAISYLKTLPPNSVKLLTSFQVVEHLTTDQLIELFHEIGRVLKKDGMIIVETPNPENINVGANTFYMDPTHIRSVPAEFLKFVAEKSGLKCAEIAHWQEKTNEAWWEGLWKSDDTQIEKSPKYRAIEEEMKKHLWCSTDYALIARK